MRQHERTRAYTSERGPSHALIYSIRFENAPFLRRAYLCSAVGLRRIGFRQWRRRGFGTLQSDLLADLDQCNSGYRHRARHTDSQRNRHRVHDIACVARRAGTECDDGDDLRYAHSSIRPGDLHGDRFQLCWIDHSRTEDCGCSCCPIQPCLSTDLDHGIGRHGNFGGRFPRSAAPSRPTPFRLRFQPPNAGSDGRDDFRHAHNSDRPGDLYSDCF